MLKKLALRRFFSSKKPERPLTIDSLKEMIASKHIHTVNLGFPDHYGRLMGKRFDADFFLDSVLKDGGHACNYLLNCDLNMDTPAEIVKWESGYGDYHMVPDHRTLRNYWIDGEVILMADLHDESHNRVPFAPREILRKQVEKADSMGFQIFTASELEFYPFKRTAKVNWDDKYRNLELNAQYPEDYNLVIGDRNEDLYLAMRKALNHSGLKVETSKGEAGTSQHEINIRYADPLTMADHHVYYKCILKHVANTFGKCITFMAKPFHDQPGSSCHIHLSLFDKSGKNIFHGNDVVLCEKRHITASNNMLYFLGGWMKNVLDVFPFYAPFVNSFKKYN